MSAILLQRVGKTYGLYRHGVDRLLESLTGRPRHRSVVALHPMDLRIEHGEIVGIVGKNGAGKSTLLKLVSRMIPPTTGHIGIHGKVAALLELGAGFHPELTGRENLFLVGAAMGLDKGFIADSCDEIIRFSEIGDFVDLPVKTYSSGMFVRLAFSLATAVKPDVLIIDEALSVGDGSFARRSFDRIMEFRDAGVTILFCSHSMYQVEALCSRVVWLNEGRLELDGEPATVVARYNEWLNGGPVDGAESPGSPGVSAATEQEQPEEADQEQGESDDQYIVVRSGSNVARIRRVEITVDGVVTNDIHLKSGVSDLGVRVVIASDPELNVPTFAIAIRDTEGRIVASAGSRNDAVDLQRDAAGVIELGIRFPGIPLLKGRYFLDAYVMCENAIHVYDAVENAFLMDVTQEGLEQGIVSLPRVWQST